jgi:very-short-patch-repair endonuclease
MLTALAKELRKNSTDAEKLLWHYLRAKQTAGLKFRRQQPIENFIVDFVCFDKKLIVELDGSQHSEKENKEEDTKRDKWFVGRGYIVLRFWNDEVLRNIDGVWQEIYGCCHPPLTPPVEGGGKLVDKL